MKRLIVLLLVLNCCTVFAQTFIGSPVVVTKSGEYKSLSKTFKIANPTVIVPQKQVDSIHAAIGYLEVPNKGLVLFNTNRPSDEADVAGILKQNSLVEICHIEHRGRWGDMLPRNKQTFEVWYTVQINGRQYYLDVQPVNLVYEAPFPAQGQILSIFNRKTGYDLHYAVGYPEHFRVMVFNQSKQLIFDSGELKFTNGDEFWSAEDNVWMESTPKALHFKIVGLNQTYEATWNGKELEGVEVVDIE